MSGHLGYLCWVYGASFKKKKHGLKNDKRTFGLFMLDMWGIILKT